VNLCFGPSRSEEESTQVFIPFVSVSYFDPDFDSDFYLDFDSHFDPDFGPDFYLAFDSVFDPDLDSHFDPDLDLVGGEEIL